MVWVESSGKEKLVVCRCLDRVSTESVPVMLSKNSFSCRLSSNPECFFSPHPPGQHAIAGDSDPSDCLSSVAHDF